MDPFKDLADCSAIRVRVIKDVMRTTVTNASLKKKANKLKELGASIDAEVKQRAMLSSSKQLHERVVAGLPSEQRVHKLLGKIHGMRTHEQYQDSTIASLEKDIAESQRISCESHNRYAVVEMLHDEEILRLYQDMDVVCEGHRRDLFDLTEQRQADEANIHEAYEKDITDMRDHVADQESTVEWLQGRNKTLRRQIDKQNKQIERLERQRVQHIDIIAVSRSRFLRKQRMMKEDGVRRKDQHERQVRAYEKLSDEKNTLHERLNKLLEDNGQLEVSSSTERAYLESQIFKLEEAVERSTQASGEQASEISRLQCLNDTLHQEKESLSQQERATLAVTRAAVEEKMAEDAYDMKWIEFVHTNIVQAMQVSLQSVKVRVRTAVERLNSSERREAALIIQNDVIRRTARVLIRKTLDLSRVGVNVITACLIEKENLTNTRALLNQTNKTIDGMTGDMSTAIEHQKQAEKNVSEANEKSVELDRQYQRRLTGKDNTHREEISKLEEQLRIAQSNEFVPSKTRDTMLQLQTKITSLQARNDQLVLLCQQMPLTPPESSNESTARGKRPFSSTVGQGDYQRDVCEGANPAPSKRKRALG